MEIVYEPHKTYPLDKFQDELRFEFPDIPHQLFEHYLIRAARTMAQDGHLIRRRVIVYTEPCVTRYLLNVPDDYDLVAILGAHAVMSCDCSVERLSTRLFDPPVGAQCCSRDMLWYDPLEKVLHIENSYCAGRYHILTAVAPPQDACELPAEYYTEYLPTLLMGTRALLLMITGRPWSNLQLGNAYLTTFNAAIRKHAVERSMNRQMGAVKMNFGRAL